MNLNEYQRLACVTDNKDLTHEQMLSNKTMGLCGEAGELTDMIKKHLYHGHALDVDLVKKELGDIQWYVATLAKLFDLDLEDVAECNIAKLKARYPEGFSKEASKNRIEYQDSAKRPEAQVDPFEPYQPPSPDHPYLMGGSMDWLDHARGKANGGLACGYIVKNHFKDLVDSNDVVTINHDLGEISPSCDSPKIIVAALVATKTLPNCMSNRLILYEECEEKLKAAGIDDLLYKKLKGEESTVPVVYKSFAVPLSPLDEYKRLKAIYENDSQQG